MKNQYHLYGYRWVVLAVFMFINLTIQMPWIEYAPITGSAAEFYHVTDLQIGFLAMSFILLSSRYPSRFLGLSIPMDSVLQSV